MTTSTAKQSREFRIAQSRRPSSFDPGLLDIRKRVFGSRADLESVPEQIGKSGSMINEVLRRILREIRLKLLFCYGMDRLSLVPGLSPSLQSPGEIIRMILRGLFLGH